MVHPLEYALPSEWELVYAMSAEPLAIIRRLVFDGHDFFRAVTGSPLSADRELIGYYRSGAAAAVAGWRRYCDAQHAQHEVVSRMHGSADRAPGLGLGCGGCDGPEPAAPASR